MDSVSQVEQIINELLRQDDDARRELHENQQRRQKMADLMAEEKEKITHEHYERAQKRLGIIRAQHEEEYQEELQALETQRGESLKNLEKSYLEHKDEWVETLFKRCLS